MYVSTQLLIAFSADAVSLRRTLEEFEKTSSSARVYAYVKIQKSLQTQDRQVRKQV